MLLDKDKDGKISRDEAVGPLADGFDMIDTNGDGFIGMTELFALKKQMDAKGNENPSSKQAVGEQPDEQVQGGSNLPDPMEMDKDGDGKISRAEAAGPLADGFDMIDTNGDGFIGMSELFALKKQMDAKGNENSDSKQAVGEQPGGQVPGGSELPDPMEMDKDGDGKISRSEASGPLADGFDMIDANGDGFVGMDELMAIMSKMGGQKDDAVHIESGYPDPAPLDKDGDGKISRSEAAGKIAEDFDTLDTNSDGLLDTNELFWASYR